jgi:hypothetical protein
VGLCRKTGKQHTQADKRTPAKPIDHDRPSLFVVVTDLADPFLGELSPRLAAWLALPRIMLIASAQINCKASARRAGKLLDRETGVIP